jgi:hypothetical protein
MHGSSLSEKLFLALGAQFIFTVNLAVFLKQKGVSTFGAGNGDRLVIGNPLAVWISGTGIKWFAFL